MTSSEKNRSSVFVSWSLALITFATSFFCFVFGGVYIRGWFVELFVAGSSWFTWWTCISVCSGGEPGARSQKTGATKPVSENRSMCAFIGSTGCRRSRFQYIKTHMHTPTNNIITWQTHKCIKHAYKSIRECIYHLITPRLRVHQDRLLVKIPLSLMLA